MASPKQKEQQQKTHFLLFYQRVFNIEEKKTAKELKAEGLRHTHVFRSYYSLLA